MRRFSQLFVSPYLLLALAVFFWAGNWVIGRALRFDAPPVALAFWRWTIALVILLPFAYRHLRANSRLIAKSWKILCLLAVLATALQHIPIYIGLHNTTATNGALLNATSPILIILLSWALIGERLSAVAVLGVAISLGGVLCIVTRGDLSALRAFSFNVGDIWVLAATLSWAAYTVCLRWRPSGLPPIALLALLAAIGVAVMLPLYLIELAGGARLQGGVSSFLGIAYIGVFATVAAYICWNGAVHQVGASKAAPFMYLMPIFTPALSIVFLGETLQPYHGLGITLILGGIYLTNSFLPGGGGKSRAYGIER